MAKRTDLKKILIVLAVIAGLILGAIWLFGGGDDVETAAGNANPAAAAGVCVGDTILKVNGKLVETGDEVGALINGCNGIFNAPDNNFHIPFVLSGGIE